MHGVPIARASVCELSLASATEGQQTDTHSPRTAVSCRASTRAASLGLPADVAIRRADVVFHGRERLEVAVHGPKIAVRRGLKRLPGHDRGGENTASADARHERFLVEPTGHTRRVRREVRCDELLVGVLAVARVGQAAARFWT